MGEGPDYEASFEVASIGMALVSLEGRFLSVNRQLCELLGYSADELIHCTFQQLTHPDDLEADMGRVRQVLAGEIDSYNMEKRYIRKDGQQTWGELSVSLLRSPTGVPVHFVSVVRDVNERVRLRDELDGTERRLKAFFELPGQWMFVLGLPPEGDDPVIVLPNPALAVLVGKTAADFQGKTFRQVGIPEAQRLIWLEAAQQAIALGQPVVLERTVNLEGSNRSFLVTFAPAGTEAGLRTLCVLAVDQTERLLANRSRAEIDEKYQVLTDSIPVMVAYLDLQGRYEWVNREYASIIGLPQRAILGESMPKTLEPDVFKPLEPALEFARSGGTTTVDLRLSPKGRAAVQARATVLPRRNTQGAVVGTLVLVVDVTEAHTLQERLRQAQRLESLGQLAGGVAHDFNNLLTVINSYASDLADGVGNPEVKLAAEEILAASDRATGLTRQLLAFSRPIDARAETACVAEVVELSQKMLGRLIREDIELVIELRSRRRVGIDPGLLEQVLVNLVINARDAMPHGGRITLTTLDEGPRLFLLVADTGEGMTEAVRLRVFDPFFSTKAEKGTGLGLTTSRDSVLSMGGTMEVASVAGQGTTFTLGFVALDGPERVAIAPARRAPLPRGHETILVVEDEGSVLEIVRRTLEAQGYTVLASRYPLQSLQLASQHVGPIHLLLSDLIMPGLSGQALADELHRLRPGLRVMFISGYEKAGGLDAARLLTKPFTPEALCLRVREALDAPQ